MTLHWGLLPTGDNHIQKVPIRITNSQFVAEFIHEHNFIHTLTRLAPSPFSKSPWHGSELLVTQWPRTITAMAYQPLGALMLYVGAVLFCSVLDD